MAEQKNLQDIHNMVEKLKALGASEESIKALWGIALETADKVIKTN